MKREGIFVEGFSDEAIAGLVTALRVAGGKKGRRRHSRYDREVVERCQEIWESSRKRLVVRMGAKRKVTHADVFAYSRGKLAGIGIETLAAFKSALDAHYERNRRTRR